MNSKRNFLSCYDRAIGLLAGAEHCTRSLERKLLLRGYGEDEVGQTLARLGEENLLNDSRFAGMWIEFRQKRRDEGGRRLVEGLQRRGVDRLTARAAVKAAACTDEYRAAFFRAKEKILARENIDKNALLSILLRKGYSLSEIRNYDEQ
jgi:SOS response regulatory protein OraA/RecX